MLLKIEMSKVVDDLESRLRGLPWKKKRKILHDVYQQVVPGRNTGKQKEGDYQRFTQGGGENLLEFVLYLEDKLRSYQMKYHADRLQEHYPAFYPPKE